MTAKDKIEYFFNMSFELVIKKLHIEDKITILELSNRSGISRDSFQRLSKKYGLKIRSPKEARSIVIEKGVCSKENHWAWGLRKENSNWAKMHSERMKKYNPSFDKEINKKTAITFSKTLTKRASDSEKLAYKILSDLNIDFEFQKPIDKYIIDFFLNEKQICLEIDSSSKWCDEKKRRAEKRDINLLNLGYKTIRINKKHLSLEFMHDILATNNVI